jgi:hypothetical protein
MQIVKPFVTTELTNERQEDNKAFLKFQQLGQGMKSWLRNLADMEPKHPKNSMVYGSRISDGSGKGEWFNTSAIPEIKPQFTPKTLINILKQDAGNYKTLYVKKRGTAELREVKAPMKPLKTLQVMLLKFLYENTTAADSAHGFVPKKGNWTAAASIAAAMKTGQRYSVLTQDLRKAFGSITEQQVRQVLRDAGLKGFQLHAGTRVATYEGKLATGSPSSPFILNLLLKAVDIKLENWAKRNGGIYRRYADDLTIVLPTWNTKKMTAARELIRRLMKSVEIELHPKKTQITRLGLDSPSAEIIGVATQQQKVTRPKRLRNRLRGAIRATRSHLRQGNQTAAVRTLMRVTGLASYFAGEYKAIKEAKAIRIRTLQFRTT